LSDLESLRQSFQAGRLLRPFGSEPSLVDLAQAIELAAGGKSSPGNQQATWIASLIGFPRHLVLAVADGLGMDLINRMPETAFLRSRLSGELLSVFPSTTAVALTSLLTGAWPNDHGILGRWTYLREAQAVAEVLVLRADRTAVEGSSDPTTRLLEHPTLLKRLNRQCIALLPEHLISSAYSRYLTNGALKLGYRTMKEGINRLIETIRLASGPTFTLMYTARIDDEAHVYGVGRPEVRAATLEFDQAIQALAAVLPADARIVVTADHGFLDAPPEARHQIGPAHQLRGLLLTPPSGDARVMYFHLRDGAEDAFCSGFLGAFGDRFFLLRRNEAEQLALFGPGVPLETTRQRMGDFIAISRGVDVLAYHPSGGLGRTMTLRSHHSGLSPQEMRVPLVVV
jgi:hypothetical protein